MSLLATLKQYITPTVIGLLCTDKLEIPEKNIFSEVFSNSHYTAWAIARLLNFIEVDIGFNDKENYEFNQKRAYLFELNSKSNTGSISEHYHIPVLFYITIIPGEFMILILIGESLLKELSNLIQSKN